MKSLKDFKEYEVSVKSIISGGDNRTETPPPNGCRDKDYFFDNNCDGLWGPGEPGNIPPCQP